MKVGILFSGGKDSTYAAYLARETHDVSCLITLNPSREDSYMFHFPNLRWTSLQARTMQIPQIIVPTEGEKEVELQDLSKALRIARDEHSVEGVYSGALASVYQKSRVERVCAELGLQSFSPLWRINPKVHLLNLIRDGFDTIITGVAALGLDESWLGRRLDGVMVEELVELQRKHGMHAALEGGEGETFVLDCPLFKERIEITSSKKHWDGMAGYLEILEARLVPKVTRSAAGASDPG
ncbi:MAG: diphthine--ammonia ligase [Nitrososphaerales archaeon]|jgi:ABC transporter with metal-binding/Fe-S-binding domain ATP-binding protein